MKNDKLSEILKKTNPPRPALPNAKAQLRRELLNSPHYRKSGFWQRLFQRQYFISAIASLLLIIMLLVLNLFPAKVSAMAVLQNLEEGYRNAIIIGKTHYLKVFIQNFYNNLPSFIEEKWQYENTFVIMAQSLENGEKTILGHTIVRNDSMYSQANFPLVYDLTAKDEDSDTLAMLPEADLNATMDIGIFPADDEGTLYVSFITSAFEFQQFFRQMPLDIIQTLKADENIVYRGEEKSENGTYQVLERRIDHAGFFMRIQDHPELHKEIHSIAKAIPLHKRAERFRETVFNKYTLIPLQSVEKLLVDQSKNRIHQIVHQLMAEDEVLDKKILTFLEDQWLDYDADIFDPAKQGLEWIDLKMYRD